METHIQFTLLQPCLEYNPYQLKNTTLPRQHVLNNKHPNSLTYTAASSTSPPAPSSSPRASPSPNPSRRAASTPHHSLPLPPPPLLDPPTTHSSSTHSHSSFVPESAGNSLAGFPPPPNTSHSPDAPATPPHCPPSRESEDDKPHTTNRTTPSPRSIPHNTPHTHTVANDVPVKWIIWFSAAISLSPSWR